MTRAGLEDARAGYVRRMPDLARPDETIDFGSLRIDADDAVLRPRAWTIEQSRWGRDLLPDLPDGRVLEICSGAGHIGLATVHGTGRGIVMVDDDAPACAVARGNASRAGVPADVREGRCEEVLDPDERFALVVADPPWVPSDQVGTYPEDPPHAIDGGPDGLAVAIECLDAMARHLLPGGVGILQIGWREQAKRLEPHLDALGLRAGELRLCPGGVLVLVERVDAGS